MDKNRLSELLHKIDDVRIAVVGDFFLDRHLYVDRDLNEPSIETGLEVYQVVERDLAPGTCGTVTNNLESLGVKKIYALGLVGNDGEAYDLIKALKERNTNTRYLVKSDIFTPTYTKVFFKYQSHLKETNRIDIINRKKISAEAEQQIINNLSKIKDLVDAVICLEQIRDSSCGVFTDRVREELSLISNEKLVLIDSRHNLNSFKNLIIKCNDHEILSAAGIELKGNDKQIDELVNTAICKIHKITGKPVIVSCGDHGIKAFDGKKILHKPAFKVHGEIDICGAGDSALAGITASLCAEATLEEAIFIGNLVASLTIQQIGKTGTTNRENLFKRFEEYYKQKDL